MFYVTIIYRKENTDTRGFFTTTSQLQFAFIYVASCALFCKYTGLHVQKVGER